ncbi:unnamed protein product [Prunus armeniaca]
MALANKWKFLNKELGKWRDSLEKARENVRSSENLGDEIIQAQMWFGAIGQDKKNAAPRFTDIGFSIGLPNGSRLTNPTSADAYLVKGGKGQEREHFKH